MREVYLFIAKVAPKVVKTEPKVVTKVDAPKAAKLPVKSRTFLFTYGGTVNSLKPGEEAKIWLPVPVSTSEQKVAIEKKELPGKDQIGKESQYGNSLTLQDWSPRLGLSWDVLGNGKSKLYATAGRYAERVPLYIGKVMDTGHASYKDTYVWGVLSPGGTLVLHFAVESPSGVSAKALAAILQHGLSGLPASEIATVSPDLVLDVFRRDISMGKGLGLMSMVRAVQVTAKQAAEAAARDPAAAGVFPRVVAHQDSGLGIRDSGDEKPNGSLPNPDS